MSELGTRLKEARLSKNLSLDDLQEITKIQKRYLIGIEEGNYSLMPGAFYVRAFIKQYAEAVGLNPEELFKEFDNEIPSTHSEDVPGQLSRVQTKQMLHENHSKVIDLLPKLLVVAVVISIFVFIWWAFSKNTGTDTNLASEKGKNNQEVTYEQSKELENDNKDNNDNSVEKAEEESKDDTNQPEETKEPEPEPVNQELTVVESSGARSTYELKSADTFQLKVVSTGETWVSISNGSGNSFFQGLLKAGGETESQTFDLSQEAEITIVAGRSSDTEIYVNDQKLEYAVSPTEVVRQNITIRYVKDDQ
ncbi:DUF4115 domain-containing protein [Niallia sp. XMNu-256]|uniref:helix-turn-helix domain-containing protein n=1 Tax=Niallia sp. XMNu-256 TaxID=3082444 RepID=UPI0030CF52F5